MQFAKCSLSFTLFRQRQQYPHREPLVLPVDGHAAAVLLGQRTEAFSGRSRRGYSGRADRPGPVLRVQRSNFQTET